MEETGLDMSWVDKIPLIIMKIIRRVLFQFPLKQNSRIWINTRIHEVVKAYVNKVIGPINELNDEWSVECETEIKPSKEKSGIKVWVSWLQGQENAPEIVKACIDSIKDNAVDLDVIILDDVNFKDYISLPPFILKKYECGFITKTHFSDILRWALMAKYGGYWIDATILLTKKIPSLDDKDLFTFKHDKDISHTYISDGRWTGFFIGVKKNYKPAKIILTILYKYWQEKNELIDYFLIDYILDIVYLSNPQFSFDINNNAYFSKDLYYIAHNLKENISPEIVSKINASEFGVFKLTYKLQGEDYLRRHSLFNAITTKRRGDFESLDHSNSL